MYNVAIDTGPLLTGHSFRGIGVNTRELLFALEKIERKDVKIEAVDFSKTDLSRYDIVHYQSFNPFFKTLPDKKLGKKVVVTIHDLIPLIYPNHYPPGIRGKINFWLQKSRLLKYVDLVITISETSKKDIVRFLNYKPEKIKVVHLAPRDIFRPVNDLKKLQKVKKKFNLPDKFILYVGDVNYNKNISTLIKACKDLDITLVIVGKHALQIDEGHSKKPYLGGPNDWIRFLFNKPHPETAHFKTLSQLFLQNKKVVRLGYVDDKDLVSVYNLASVYVQPSLYEGFGLPVLEAMACGTPVIASKINAHREIADNKALFFNPKDVLDLQDKIRLVIEDKSLASELSQKSLGNVKKYSWEKTAKGVLKAYEEIL
jgi:glycosyltransferase involved in cell wall biosynthesis